MQDLRGFSHGTQAYENALVEIGKKIVESITDEDDRRKLTTCKDHLKVHKECRILFPVVISNIVMLFPSIKLNC